MLADEREINLRPWLYRIARNRCLNHLRKPTADAQESMDMVPTVEAASTAEKVHNREEFRQLLTDVSKLPETQRSALLLREMDALSYEEIAQAMETSVPSVKSLLVRARISLAEASQARQLTCGEVRLELAEAAEGLRKVSGPVRRHVRDCEECADFRSQVRSNDKVAGGAVPGRAADRAQGLHRSPSSASAGRAPVAARSRRGRRRARPEPAPSAASARRSAAAARPAASAPIGGAIGTKAVAGVVTAAVITAGAVEVKQHESPIARASHKTPTCTGRQHPRAPQSPRHMPCRPPPAAVAPGAERRSRRPAPAEPAEPAPASTPRRPPAKPPVSPPAAKCAEATPTVADHAHRPTPPPRARERRGRRRHGRGHRRRRAPPPTKPPPSDRHAAAPSRHHPDRRPNRARRPAESDATARSPESSAGHL